MYTLAMPHLRSKTHAINATTARIVVALTSVHAPGANVPRGQLA
jgi:hypothetical protein